MTTRRSYYRIGYPSTAKITDIRVIGTTKTDRKAALSLARLTFYKVLRTDDVVW